MRFNVKHAAVALTAGSLALAGCGSGVSASAKSGGKYKVGIVMFAGADPTSSAAVKAYTDTAKPMGYQITTIDPQGQTDQAVAAMQTLVQKRVDMIIVTVFPSTSLTAGLQAAKAARIPVISLSGGLADGVEVDLESGVTPGGLIAQQLLKDSGGKGDFLALGYKSGLPCIGREQALNQALRGTSLQETREEVPIPGQVEAATQFTQAFLAKHPAGGQGLAVWGCFDDPSLGAVAAIRQARRSGVRVYGVNGQPGALKAIQDGDMTATVWLDIYQAGQNAATSTAKWIKAGVGAKPTEIPIPAVLVTRDTVAEFLKAHPNAMKGL